ncbi:MAG: alpha/beta fold hydrolase [Flavobacteriaceae bacterium]
MKKIHFSFISVFVFCYLSFGQVQKEVHTVQVNGAEIYYEVYGEGEPLLLLHGWTQSSVFWKDYLTSYAQNFKVYVLDLRGHGRSSPLTQEFSLQKASMDILMLLDHLNLRKVKAIGFSYGSLLLLQLAALNPQRIETMILIGCAQQYDGADNTSLADDFSYDNLPESFKQELKKIHFHGESQIKALFNKDLNYRIMLEDEKIKERKANTIIVHGDRDEIIGLDKAVDLYQNLANAELWIVPNTGHLVLTAGNKKSFMTKSLQFLYKKKTKKP